MTFSYFLGKFKNGPFWPNWGHFWSLDEVVGDLRIRVRASICPYVTLLLENRSLLFSETLQLVRACKCEKNVPSAFLKKNPVSPILAKNCPKLCATVFETDFKQVLFVFRQTTHTYSESWGPVENLLNYFPLILPKKHSFITQNRFWLNFEKNWPLPPPPRAMWPLLVLCP